MVKKKDYENYIAIYTLCFVDVVHWLTVPTKWLGIKILNLVFKSIDDVV